MKKLVVLCLLVASSIVTFAQTSKSIENTSRFSIGFDALLPLGSFAQNYSFGRGLSLKYEFKTVNKLLFNLTGSYSSFPEKGSSDGLNTQENVSLKLGGKYYLKKRVFGEAQVGFIFGTYGEDITSFFAFSPGVGYSFDNGFEAGIRYEAWLDNHGIKYEMLSHLGLRVAYRF